MHHSKHQDSLSHGSQVGCGEHHPLTGSLVQSVSLHHVKQSAARWKAPGPFHLANNMLKRRVFSPPFCITTAGVTSVSLGSPSYGTSGAFAVSFWVRTPQDTPPPSSDSYRPQADWQYLFSQTTSPSATGGGLDSSTVSSGGDGSGTSGSGTTTTTSSIGYSAFSPNSINIYTGAAGGPLYGVVRAVVKVRPQVLAVGSCKACMH